MSRKAAVVTISDRVSRGEAEDRGGPLAADMLAGAGFEVVESRVVRDDPGAITAAVVSLCDSGIDLVVTTGGTGLGPRDITPDTLAPLFDKTIPGMAEAMRATTLGRLPQGMLSRQVAGTRGRTVIVALPGSAGGVREGLEAVAAALPHAIDVLQDHPGH